MKKVFEITETEYIVTWAFSAFITVVICLFALELFGKI